MTVKYRRIGLAIFTGLVVDVLNKISPLFVLHHAQKALGLPDFGWAFYQLALFEAMQPFVVFGFSQYALGELSAQGHGSEKKLFTHLFALKFLNALALLLCYFIQGGFSGIDFQLLWVLLFMLASVVFDAYWYLIYSQKIAMVNLVTGLLRIVSLVSILTMVQSPSDRYLFLILSLLPNVAVSFFTGIWSMLRLSFAALNVAQMGKILIKAAPFALIMVGTTLLDRVDLFLVGRHLGMESAGIYAGPAKVIQSLTLAATPVIVPFLAEMLVVKDKVILQKHVSLSLLSISALTAPIAFGLPLIAPRVMEILFPQTPASAAPLLSILGFGMVGTLFFSVFASQVLVSQAKPWPIVFAAAVGLVSVPVVSLSFAHFYTGTHTLWVFAVAMVTGKALLGGTALFFARPYLLKVPWAAVLKPMLAGALMWVVVQSLGWENLVPNVLAGAFVYLASLLGLGRKEILVLWNNAKLRSTF